MRNSREEGDQNGPGFLFTRKGRVGIVGIGIDGHGDDAQPLNSHFEVVGYDIADRAMARLAEAGGIAATSPRDVAEKAEVLITCCPMSMPLSR